MPEAFATLFKESIVRVKRYYVISFRVELFNVRIAQTNTERKTHRQTLTLC